MPDALPVRWVDTVPSTQELAHLLAAEGAPHGTSVAAREQRDGRGTRGRRWHSPLGGLWMSVVCRPATGASAEAFSLRVGVAVARAVMGLDDRLRGLRVKWPNDLFLDGRKLGGILCEGRWQGASLTWVVAGIGINVRNPIPPEVADTATRVAAHAPELTPEALAGPVAEAIAGATRTGGPLRATERSEFRALDLLAGRRLVSPVPGTAEGIDAMGALRVRDEHGVVHQVTDGPAVLA